MPRNYKARSTSRPALLVNTTAIHFHDLYFMFSHGGKESEANKTTEKSWNDGAQLRAAVGVGGSGALCLPYSTQCRSNAVQFGREGWDVSEEVYEGNNKREGE